MSGTFLYGSGGLFPTIGPKLIPVLVVALSLLVGVIGAGAQEETTESTVVDLDEHLGEYIPGDIFLTDEYG